MAELNCSACEDIRQTAPEFVVSGLTDNICTSLSNNTGLNPSSGHDDCTDLHNVNDCLIGNMETEVEAYDVCDWKAFMKNFIPNVWTTIKAIICSFCGIWANITDLWTKVNKHDCEIQTLMDGISFRVDEEETDTSYVVAGKGVSFLKYDTGDSLADVSLIYIGGGLARIQGTLSFRKDNFTEDNGGVCWCFDTDAENPVRRNSRKGNDAWHNVATTSVGGESYHLIKGLPANGELIFEIRIKKSEYPFLKQLISGIGGPTGGGMYQVNIVVGSAGSSLHGQNGSSPSHTVPDGWIYVQARMVNIGYLNATEGHHYSPRGFLGIRFNRSEIEC